MEKVVDTSNNTCDEYNECNICYETPKEKDHIICLECCNFSKKICISCMYCLSAPICPYCRTKLKDNCLPYLNQNENVSRSEPPLAMSWEHFIQNENIINPYLYDDSRRLRRQIRRLRYEYQQRISSRTTPIPSSSRRRKKRNNNQRQELQSYSREMMDTYNDHHEDSLMFEIDM